MQFINNLLEKISVFSINTRPIFLFLLLVLLMYGGMFLIALIGESRILHFWEFQSRTFFPGGLLLCFAIMMSFRDWYFLGREVDYVLKNNLSIIGIAASLSFFITGRKVETFIYPKRARYSPTKLYHDILVYFVFGFIVFARLVPGIVITGRKYGAVVLARVLILYLIFMGPYCVLLARDMDMCAKVDEITSEKRHPSNWAPIWKTKKILK